MLSVTIISPNSISKKVCVCVRYRDGMTQFIWFTIGIFTYHGIFCLQILVYSINTFITFHIEIHIIYLNSPIFIGFWLISRFLLLHIILWKTFLCTLIYTSWLRYCCFKEYTHFYLLPKMPSREVVPLCIPIHCQSCVSSFKKCLPAK